MLKMIRKELIFVPLVLLAGCRNPCLQRINFEDQWWQPEEFDLCFNLHRLGDDTAGETQTLVYYSESGIDNIGEWRFEDPNKYHIEDNYLTVERREDEECWDVALHYGIDPVGVIEDVACECTMKEDKSE